jgi:hypothetical protein
MKKPKALYSALGFRTRSRSGLRRGGRPRVHFDGAPDLATWRRLEDPGVKETSDPRIVSWIWGLVVGLVVGWFLCG